MKATTPLHFSQLVLCVLLAALLFAANACSDDDAGNGDAPDSGQQDTGQQDAEDDTSMPTASSCEELEAASCFSNLDCPQTHLCYNVSNTDTEVACCVEGSRGTRAAGEPCDADLGQTQCQSGVCVGRDDGSHVCTTTCTDDADCPEGMQRCVTLPGLESEHISWCFPE